jgi:GntR family transcriptional regulator, vanillate catabolism transcriptional regulator
MSDHAYMSSETGLPEATRALPDPAAPGHADRGPSRTQSALLAIRELILDGVLARGARISELVVAERTGLSRTPIRAALQRLEGEGLVKAIPSGGFAVQSFSERDVFDAIEIRGTLEGLAARFAAERGADPARMRALHGILDALDDVTEGPLGTEAGFARYMALNADFHARLVDLAASPTLARQIARSAALPFGSPSGFVRAQSLMPDSRRLIAIAQDQHRCVAEAIAAREGARAEAIMREHARLAARNLRLALRSERTLWLVPGRALIRVSPDDPADGRADGTQGRP